MTPKPPAECVVCHAEVGRGAILCKPCGRSYDRARFKDMTMAAAIEWAADRAWRFARQDNRPVISEMRRRELEEDDDRYAK